MKRQLAPWASKEDDALRSAIRAGTSLSILSETLGRSASAIKSRAYVLRLSLRLNPLKRLAKITIWNKRRSLKPNSLSLSKLGLKAMTRNRRWTPEEDGKLRALVEDRTSAPIIAAQLKRTVYAVKKRSALVRRPLKRTTKAPGGQKENNAGAT